MFEAEVNGGLIFNQFPKLMTLSSRSGTTDSEFIVKFARSYKGDDNITADQQFFRNFRNGAVDVEAFIAFFGLNNEDRINFIHEDLGKSKPGGWLVFRSIVLGMKRHLSDTKELEVYWHFLIAHAEVEREFYDTSDETQINQYLKDWLAIDEINLEKKTVGEFTRYIVNMVMYWAALFEFFIELYFQSKDACNFASILPKLVQTRGAERLSFTTEQFLEGVKERYSSINKGSPKVSWEHLFKEIIRKQILDPDLETRVESHSLSHVAPDTRAIKKRFQRWRDGDLISLPDARMYLAILFASYEDTQNHFQIDAVVFINLFTHIQKELLKAKMPPEGIVGAFSDYSDIKNLVVNRYEIFANTGKLRSQTVST
ncbi:hypothetical protein [Vibrio breoganii]|uniref:hypothetical protein n=1 Tax=Vibrio breoganii TaxID=553239 RepID=UPI000C84761D|nr:hypothetical protein [Vibrio breoganii]PMK20456.1 hypothetical protein BCU06_06705 [Vibrio breoganii]